CGRECYFAKDDTNIGVYLTGQIAAFGIAQLFTAVPVLRSFALSGTEGGRFERFFSRDHNTVSGVTGQMSDGPRRFNELETKEVGFPSPALPGSGFTGL